MTLYLFIYYLWSVPFCIHYAEEPEGLFIGITETVWRIRVHIQHVKVFQVQDSPVYLCTASAPDCDNNMFVFMGLKTAESPGFYLKISEVKLC